METLEISYSPFLSFWLTPVSENDRVCPLSPLPGPFWPSEKDERLCGACVVERCRDWSVFPPRSLLWVELWELRRSLRCPRLPMAKYSGPSSESPPPPYSSASGWRKELVSVNEIEGMDAEPGEGVAPRAFSPGLVTTTHSDSRLLVWEVVSARQMGQIKICTQILLMGFWFFTYSNFTPRIFCPTRACVCTQAVAHVCFCLYKPTV